MPSLRPSATWRYALLGGIASIPLTLAAYWLSGTGSEFSLNMVFFGGLVAGYLARRGSAAVDGDAVGIRAGVIGGVPAVAWMASRTLPTAVDVSGTLPFRVGAVAVTGVLAAFAVVLGALVGLLGAKVGGWLAKKLGGGRPPVADA